MVKAGQVVTGRQFSIASLLILTAVVAIVLGLARIIVPAALAVTPADLTMLAWLGGMTALAGAVAIVYFYANR